MNSPETLLHERFPKQPYMAFWTILVINFIDYYLTVVNGTMFMLSKYIKV
jgi:hypothetical protein